MFRKNFLEFGEKKKGFEIINEKSEGEIPSGVSAEMLWNLWDIGSKFGQKINRGIGYKAGPLTAELYTPHSKGMGGYAGLFVAKDGETGRLEQGIFIFELKNRITVMWDKRITPQEIAQIIEEIDEGALREGLIEGGARIVRSGTISSPFASQEDGCRH